MIVLRHCIPFGIIIGLSLLLSQVTAGPAHADGGFFDEEFEFEEEEETFFYEEEPLYYQEEEDIVEVFDEYEFDESYDSITLDEEIDISDIEYEEFEEKVFDDYASYETQTMMSDDMMMSDGMMSDGMMSADGMMSDGMMMDDFEDYGNFDDEYGDYGAGSVGGCFVGTSASVETGLLTIDCSNWTMSLTGLVQIDAAFLNSVDSDIASSFADVRRALLGIKGSYYRDWKYSIIGAFAAPNVYNNTRTKAGLDEAIISYAGFSDVEIKVGLMALPFTLDQYNAYNSTYFMERAFFDDLTRFGIMGILAKDNNTISLAAHIGGLGDGDGEREAVRDNGDVGIVGRITSAFEFRNRFLLHLGFSGRYANMNNEVSKEAAIFSSGAPFTATFSDAFSTAIAVGHRNDELYAINPEIALVMGAVGFQAEYTLLRPTIVSTAGVQSDSTLHLWYAQMNYWLTGEKNEYDFSTGTFTRVVPRHNFIGAGRGTGAIGLGARYQYADFQDGVINSGRSKALTVNMTWKPNPYMKFISEFTRAWVSNTAGKESPYGIQFRAQVDW